MNRRITIVEEGNPALPAIPTEAAASRFDVADYLFVGAVACFEAGVAAIYWPAALICAGLMGFGLVWLIDREKSREAVKMNRSRTAE